MDLFTNIARSLPKTPTSEMGRGSNSNNLNLPSRVNEQTNVKSSCACRS